MINQESTLPDWWNRTFIFGAEGEEDEEDAPDDQDESEDGTSEEDEEDTEGETEEEDQEEGEKLNDAGLKSALKEERKRKRAERKLRIAAEKRVQQLESAQNKKKKTDDSDSDETSEKLRKSLEVNQKLASRVLDQTVASAIISEARKIGFIDAEDALQIRKLIEVDQDPEDPTDIDFDQDNVKEVVADLAKKKPHLLVDKKTTTSKTRSGSKMTKGNKKTKSLDKSKEYTDLYPSLR